VKAAQAAAYGSAELGLNASETFLRLHLLAFATLVLGLDPAAAGWALAAGLLWDAVCDPFMGSLSDRLGKRRVFVLWGTPLFAAAFALLFRVPPSLTALALGYLLLNTLFTVVSVPYAAWASDLDADPARRTRLFAWRLFFGNLGAILATALPAYYLGKDTLAPYPLIALWIAAAIFVSGIISALSCAERVHSVAPAKVSLLAPLKGRAYLRLLLAYVVATLGLALNSSAALFYYRERLAFSEGQIGGVLALFLLVFSLGLPLWVQLASRFGKRRPLLWGTVAMGLHTCVVYPLLPAGHFGLTLAVVSGLGGLFVGSFVLLEALVADLSAPESQGAAFGLWKFGSKAARALALGLSGAALSWAGVGGASGVDATRLSWLFGPGVGVFFLAAAFIAWRLPETRPPAAPLA
jgi:GPH family glycoside/pentoside/hexuronide:cation symporter